MDGILAGKLALVTCGGRGIGAAIARAGAGARVIVCGRTQADLDALAREIGGVALRLDLTDRQETDEVIASVGHVDVLVNNAGVAESAALDRTTDALWPGWVQTQMVDEAVTRIATKTGRSEDEARTQLAAMSPQRRIITPSEV